MIRKGDRIEILPGVKTEWVKKTEAQVSFDQATIQDRLGAGTHDDPYVYKLIDLGDPDRQAKLAAQRAQFERDADSGKVISLSNIFSSHGL